MDSYLDRISLCTFSTGGSMVREVLDDWFRFLGGRPRRVIFAVTPEDRPPPVYEELRAEGLIDTIIGVAGRGRPVEGLNAEAVHAAVTAATTEWVLVLKLDTLPYRAGHPSWLSESLRLVEDHGLFGLTGSFPLGESPRLTPGYRTSQNYSENFGILRKADWLRAVDAFVGDAGYAGESVRQSRFRDLEHRFINEHSIKDFLEANGLRLLAREEARDWSVFTSTCGGRGSARSGRITSRVGGLISS